MSKYRFQCAGTFSGVTSFKDDDGDDVHMLKVDFFGGKVNIMISPDVADRLSSKKSGSDVRLQGDVIIGGGSFKPAMSAIQFEGDKDFEAVSAEESFQGLVFSGPAFVDSKRSFVRRDGSESYQVTFKLFGATFSDFPVSSEAFSQIQEGPIVMFGQIISEVKKNFKGDLVSKNWLTFLRSRPIQEGRTRK